MAEKLEAVVEFDYKSQEPDELTLKKGDTITDIRKQPGGWWEGTLARTGKKGMFPDNFVKVLELSSSKMDVSLRAVPGRRCKVLFSYQPVNEDELELQVGDMIDILAEVEEGWWRGKLNSQVGVFPSNFVSEVFDDPPETKEASHRKTSRSSVDSDTAKQTHANSMNHEEPEPESQVPELPPKPMKELCRVMYQYDAVNDDELTLREGDVITLISREGQDKGWWRGELNGKQGVFPDNFVEVITSDETSKPARPPGKTSATTTNRARDSITRTTPQTTKHIELPPKPEEKTSPPGISKKPVLPPPPLKKPQRSPSGASINKTLGASQTESIASTQTKPPDSPTNTGVSAKIPLTPLTFLLKQSGDGVDGGCLSRSSGSFTLTNHETEAEVDLDCVGRAAMLTHPTASRVRAPRRRPPSGLPPASQHESGEAMPGVGAGTGAGLVNGNAEPHVTSMEDRVKAPWVEELKMNQAKKSAQGRTRVMIGGEPSAAEREPEPPKVSPVTLRGQSVGSGGVGSGGSTRPQSMFGGRSFSLSPSSPDTITVSHKQWMELNEKVQRLESRLEAQTEALTKSLSELAVRLTQEGDKRAQMQAELDKLANFVTQV